MHSFTKIVLSSLLIPGISGSVNALDIKSAQSLVTQVSIPSNSTDSGSTDSTVSKETAVYDQINKYRASFGLSPLSLDSRISKLARTHSQNMANGAVPLGHDGFEQRVQALAKAIPYLAAAENVASNQGYNDPATQAVQGWLKSDGHRRHIEGQYNLTGIGIALNAKGQYYFTQIFVNVP